MRTNLEERACELAGWIIENEGTVRSAAAHFGVSKSTVHKDLTERLEYTDRLLYEKVRRVLEVNKAERHLRGGDATRRKYKGESAGTNRQGQFDKSINRNTLDISYRNAYNSAISKTDERE